MSLIPLFHPGLSLCHNSFAPLGLTSIVRETRMFFLVVHNDKNNNNEADDSNGEMSTMLKLDCDQDRILYQYYHFPTFSFLDDVNALMYGLLVDINMYACENPS